MPEINQDKLSPTRVLMDLQALVHFQQVCLETYSKITCSPSERESLKMLRLSLFHTASSLAGWDCGKIERMIRQREAHPGILARTAPDYDAPDWSSGFPAVLRGHYRLVGDFRDWPDGKRGCLLSVWYYACLAAEHFLPGDSPRTVRAVLHSPVGWNLGHGLGLSQTTSYECLCHAIDAVDWPAVRKEAASLLTLSKEEAKGAGEK